MEQVNDLELFPGSSALGKPVFKTYEESERFYRSFYEEMKPLLDEQAERRARSHREAMNSSNLRPLIIALSR